MESIFHKVYNYGVGILKFIQPRIQRRVMVSYFHTLSGLFEALLSPRWRKEFHVTLIQRPGKKIVGRCFRTGWPILQSDVSGEIANCPPALTVVDKTRLREIRSRWEELNKSLDYRQRFIFREKPPWKALENVLEEEFFERLDHTANWLAFLENYFTRNRLGAVILADDSLPVSLSVVVVARRFGVPSFVVLHGLLSDNQNQGMLYGAGADHVAVSGPEIRSQFDVSSKGGERVLVNSSPLFDRYAARQHSFSPSTGLVRRVLALTHPFDFGNTLSCVGDSERHVLTVARLLSGFQEVTGTIKLHPSENLDYYLKLMKGFPGIKVVKKGDIDRFILAHDFVLATTSTVLLQAALLGRRIVYVNFSRANYDDPFREGWGFPVARTPSDLEKILRREFSSDPGPAPDYSALIQGFAGRIDGDGARRFLEKVRSTVQ
ncbi:MAG: hypothetical protein IPN19_06665 [Elusimicrobia bacterium]|nr:hypothetical protein [Elusimicrobiota bacterium]